MVGAPPEEIFLISFLVTRPGIDGDSGGGVGGGGGCLDDNIFLVTVRCRFLCLRCVGGGGGGGGGGGDGCMDVNVSMIRL